MLAKQGDDYSVKIEIVKHSSAVNIPYSISIMHYLCRYIVRKYLPEAVVICKKVKMIQNILRNLKKSADYSLSLNFFSLEDRDIKIIYRTYCNCESHTNCQVK